MANGEGDEEGVIAGGQQEGGGGAAVPRRSPPRLLRRTSTAGGAILNEPMAVKIPRGRSNPPNPPEPTSRRRSSLISMGVEKIRQKSTTVLFVPKDQLAGGGKKKPEWQTSYFGFKRKIHSSLFVPLLSTLFLGCAGIHITALTGARAPGYFSWNLVCEQVVSGGASASLGFIEYTMGWATFDGVPQGNVPEGSASEEVLREAPLSDVNGCTAALGYLTALVHSLGILISIAEVAMTLGLFASHFRSKRKIFRGMFVAAAVMLLLTVVIPCLAFNLNAQGAFVDSVVDVLEADGNQCVKSGGIKSDFAYIASTFTCVVYFLQTLSLHSRYKAADEILQQRFARRRGTLQDDVLDSTEKGVKARPSRRSSEMSSRSQNERVATTSPPTTSVPPQAR